MRNPEIIAQQLYATLSLSCILMLIALAVAWALLARARHRAQRRIFAPPPKRHATARDFRDLDALTRDDSEHVTRYEEPRP